MKQVIIIILVTITLATCDKLDNRYLPPQPDAFAASANNHFSPRFSNYQQANSFQKGNIDQKSPVGNSKIQNGNFQSEAVLSNGNSNQPKEEQVKFTSSRFNNDQKQSGFGNSNGNGFPASKLSQYLPPWNGFGAKSAQQQATNGFTNQLNQQSDLSPFANRQAAVIPFGKATAEKSSGNFNQKPYNVFGNSNQQLSREDSKTSPTTQTSSSAFNQDRFGIQTGSKYNYQKPTSTIPPSNVVSTSFQAQQKQYLAPSSRFGADDQDGGKGDENGKFSASQGKYPGFFGVAKETEGFKDDLSPFANRQASVNPFGKATAEKSSSGNFNQKPYGVFGNSNQQSSNEDSISDPKTSPTTQPSPSVFNQDRFGIQTESKYNYQKPTSTIPPSDVVSTSFQAQQKQYLAPSSRFGADGQDGGQGDENGRFSASQGKYPGFFGVAKETEGFKDEFPPNGGQQYDSQGGYKY